MAKLKQQPKRVGSWLYRKLPWYGKILVPIFVLVGAFYLVEWLAGVLFGIY